MGYVLSEQDDPIPMTIPWTERARVWIMWVLASISGAGIGIMVWGLFIWVSLEVFAVREPFWRDLAYIAAGAIIGTVLGWIQGLALQHIDDLQAPENWGLAITRRLPPRETVPLTHPVARWQRLSLVRQWCIAATLVGAMLGALFPGLGVTFLGWVSATEQLAPMTLWVAVAVGAAAGGIIGLVWWVTLRDHFAGAIVLIPLYMVTLAGGLAGPLVHYHPLVPAYTAVDGTLEEILGQGLFLAFVFSLVLSGAALAWGLRPPDSVVFRSGENRDQHPSPDWATPVRSG